MQLQNTEGSQKAPKMVFKISKVKNNSKFARVIWTKSQDDILKKLVEKHGGRHWKKIGLEMKAKFTDLPINGKKCRERWINSGKSGIDRRPLSVQEDLMLLINHQIYSNSWSAISKKMPTRNASTLKNNFYSLIKKVARQALLFSKGETINEATPLQFYSSLYIVIILIRMLEDQGDESKTNFECGKNKAPPHIVEYISGLHLAPKTYIVYIEYLKNNYTTFQQFCNADTAEALRKLDFAGLKTLCNSFPNVIPQYMGFLSVDQSISASLERILSKPNPQLPSLPPYCQKAPTPRAQTSSYYSPQFSNQTQLLACSPCLPQCTQCLPSGECFSPFSKSRISGPSPMQFSIPAPAVHIQQEAVHPTLLFPNAMQQSFNNSTFFTNCPIFTLPLLQLQ